MAPAGCPWRAMTKAPQSVGGASRILLVEDYEDARDMYAELLRLSGYSVATAANGDEALERALGEDFDLVVMDIALPKRDGLSVIEALRSEDRTKSVPIIGVSAMAGDECRKAALTAGANLFLEKPCLPEELEQAVRHLLHPKARAAE